MRAIALGLLLTSVAWAQDGQPPRNKLMFTQGTHAKFAVMRLDLGSGKVDRLLPDEPRGHLLLSASPRGSRVVIAYSKGREDRRGLHVRDVLGRRLKLNLPLGTIFAAFIDEEQLLVTAHLPARGGHQLLRIKIADGSIKELLTSNRAVFDDAPLRVAPGGGWAAYTTRGEGDSAVTVVDLATGKPMHLPGCTFSAWLGPERLLVFDKEARTARLYDAMPPQKPTADDFPVTSAPVGPAGEGALAYARLNFKARSIQLVRRHLDSKTDVALGKPFGFNEMVMLRPLAVGRVAGRLVWVAGEGKKRYGIYRATPDGAKLGDVKRLHTAKDGEVIGLLFLTR